MPQEHSRFDLTSQGITDFLRNRVNPGIRDGLLKTRGHVAQHLETLRAGLENIERDRNLSDIGKKGKAAELAKKSRDYLAKYAADNNYSSALAEYTRQLSPKVDTREPVLQLLDELRMRETREHIMRTLPDPLLRLAAYMGAVADGNEELARSFETAPLTIQAALVGDPSVLATGAAERMAQAHPEIQAKLVEVQAAASAFKDIMGAAFAELDALDGGAPDTTLESIAAGGSNGATAVA